MRSLTLKSAALMAMASVSLAAHAVDGTVTINGTVTATTCTVNVNGGASSSATVTLPTVGTTALAGVGAVAGATPFTIGVTGCTTAGGITTMAPYFEQAGTPFNGNGRLTSGVSGVDIEILNGSGTAVTLAVTGSAATQNVASVNFSGANPSRSATASFVARYRSTSNTPGTGAVSVNVAYSITYQ